MSENNNYSHIVIIKVWSNTSESITDYGNIENFVKEYFLERTWSHKGINLNFKKINLSRVDKALGLSNIVIDNPFDSDEILLSAITNIINYIDKELHQIKRLNNNDTIIFKVIKPLIDRIKLDENIAIL